mgnify:CR=1 FL=1
MKSRLKKLLRTRPVRKLIGWGFGHMDFLLPVERLRETPHLLAFHHPRPAYPFHVVIVPREEVASFVDLDPADPFLADLVSVTQSLVAEFHLPAYRLVVNGGEYQDFPHLHFHLVSGDASGGKRS